MPKQELVEEICKQIIKKFGIWKVQSFFIDNTWGTDLADMQLISKFNKETHSLLCVIDILSKYISVVPLKSKKGITITNAFHGIIGESGCKTKTNVGR